MIINKNIIADFIHCHAPHTWSRIFWLGTFSLVKCDARLYWRSELLEYKYSHEQKDKVLAFCADNNITPLIRKILKQYTNSDYIYVRFNKKDLMPCESSTTD